jgi:hypothetical protein
VLSSIRAFVDVRHEQKELWNHAPFFLYHFYLQFEYDLCPWMIRTIALPWFDVLRILFFPLKCDERLTFAFPLEFTTSAECLHTTKLLFSSDIFILSAIITFWGNSLIIILTPRPSSSSSVIIVCELSESFQNQ